MSKGARANGSNASAQSVPCRGNVCAFFYNEKSARVCLTVCPCVELVTSWSAGCYVLPG